MRKRTWKPQPPPIDGVIDQLLWNWAQWVNAPVRGGVAIARSLEGKYRAEPGGEEQPEGYEPVNPWCEIVDEFDAQRVHSILRHPYFPSLEWRFINAYYLKRERWAPVCRACVITISKRSFDEQHARSLNVTRNRLTAAFPKIYKPTHNSPSAQTLGVRTCQRQLCADDARPAKTEALEA